MSGGIQVEAKGDLLIVSESTSDFVAIYAKPNERPRLTLMRRTPTTDNVLLAGAFQAAVIRRASWGGLPDTRNPATRGGREPGSPAG
jgi:hypothetical protein